MEFDNHTFVKREIERAESEAREAIATIGLAPEDLIGLYVAVSAVGIAWIGIPDKFDDILFDGRKPTDDEPLIEGEYADPLQSPHVQEINLAWTGAMLWSCCQYVREAHKPSPSVSFIIGQTIARLRLALQFPEIRGEMLHEVHSEWGGDGAIARIKALSKKRAPIKTKVQQLGEQEWEENLLLDREAVKRKVLEKYPAAQDIPNPTLNKWLREVDPRAPDERRGPKLKHDK